MSRRGTAVLAALALALNGLLHALCLPMTAGAVPLCTSSGITWVPAGDPSDAPAHSDQDCPACQAGHCGTAFAPPAALALSTPIAFATASLVFPPQQAPTAAPRRLAQARGPPLLG